MLYVIDQDGLSIIPIKKNDVVTVKKNSNTYKYYVRKERQERGPAGDIIFDWLGTYDTTKETAEAVKRLAEARLCEYSSTFKMPRNGFLGEKF